MSTKVELGEATSSRAEVAKAQVLQRLEDRHAARAKDGKDVDELGSRDPKESVELFYQTLNVKKADLAESIAKLASLQQDAARQAAEAAATELQALEKGVADAAYYLPAYDQRSAAGHLAGLRQLLEEARRQAVPQKRFAFSSKKKQQQTQQQAQQGMQQQQAQQQQGQGQQGTQEEAGAARPMAEEAAKGRAVAANALAGEQSRRRGEGEEQEAPSSSGTAAVISRVDPDRVVRGLRDTTVVRRLHDGGGDFVLAELTGCRVFLLGGPLSALWLYRLTDCQVYCGPVEGATFMDEASGCILMLASRQARVHRAESCDLYLRLRSNPIVEHSRGLRFAPSTWGEADPAQRRLLEGCGLGQDGGQWAQVQDFDWLRATQSPNWCLLPEDERAAPPDVPEL